MNIERRVLIDHLSHIYTDGLLPDIVLSGQFQGVGASIDRQVLVITGPLEKSDPFSEAIGITNLGLLIKVLDSMEDDQISLSIEDRAIVAASHDRVFRLVTSAPRVIGTRIDEAIQAKVLELVPPTADWRPLEHRLVTGVLSAARILSAEVIKLSVSSAGGVMIVGDPRLNVGQFELPDLKSAVEYSLLLSASALVPVFKQLVDFTKVQMTLTGPDSVIAIKEGSYTYVISPDRPETPKK